MLTWFKAVYRKQWSVLNLCYLYLDLLIQNLLSLLVFMMGNLEMILITHERMLEEETSPVCIWSHSCCYLQYTNYLLVERIGGKHKEKYLKGLFSKEC